MLDKIEPGDARIAKAANLLTGPVLLFLFGLARWGARRRGAGVIDTPSATGEDGR